MISRMTKTAATASILTLMASTAYAGCNNSLYCSDAVSAYESAPAYGSVTLPGAHIGSSSAYSHGSVTLPGTHISSSYGGVASDSYADATYGSGSISGAYIDHSSVGSTYRTATASNLTMPGLGANERLYPTNCGVNVHGAEGARVIGCYNIAQPVQVQPVVRVVRPVVYVRRPVIVRPVPVCQPVWHGHYQQTVCR